MVISDKNEADPMAGVQEQFTRCGMEKTREQNAVLIVLAPVRLSGDCGVKARL
jgi:hypothetical protein